MEEFLEMGSTGEEEFLAIGSEGEKVRQLQEELKARGYEIKVDGIFGEETRAVVIRFQESQDLKQDSIVGPKTKEALGEVNAFNLGPSAGIIAIADYFTPSPTPKPK
ncbi:Peptidoglycan-binding (PGRP) domain of peptidoglycan hydrolases-containing protein [Planktothrix rubescens]|nr:Peptidoglycan-binding (PGRP) domain of peptidoglycan hydrolases-containing protein [Planktothrix rubescens]CAH2574657.1 Peptidoglycan-binding (PGRP) domain of peptidoglycan hydrolases-containing protein [Planktothrix rubescens]